MIALLENAKSLDLSENEKELLYYLENSCKEVVSMTLSQLAKATYMSNASIMRFCNKLGLSGFNELKYELKQSMHQEIDYQMIIEKPLSRFLDNLKNLNYEIIEEVVDLLCSPQPIYVVGRSLSLVAGGFFLKIFSSFRFSSIDINCILINDLHLSKSVFNNLKAPATIFIVSANNAGKIYDEVVTIAKTHDCKIILLTSNAKGSLVDSCDYVLSSNDENLTYHGVDINSRLGIFTIMQIIIELTAQKLALEKATD